MNDRVEHPTQSPSLVMCRERKVLRNAPADWNRIFRDLQDQLDMARRPSSQSSAAEGSPVAGPAHLAITVVAEALAVAVALGDAVGEAGNQPHERQTADSAAESAETTAFYAGMDCRYLDHRAKALRHAINTVDDYVWWGGLGGASSKIG